MAHLPLSTIVAVALGAALLIAAGFLLRRLHRSRLSPQRIVGEAWTLLPRTVRGEPLIVLGIALAIASGTGLQLFFGFRPTRIAPFLPAAGVLWQALSASAAAALATRVHRFVFACVPGATPEASFPRTRLRLAFVAALYGLAIWVVGYVIGVLGRVGIAFAPPMLRPFVQLILDALSFIALTPLSLARPLLAIGRRWPVPHSLRLAKRHTLALYVTIGLLLVTAVFVPIACIHLPRIMMGADMDYRPVSLTAFTLFTIAQFIVVEIATAIFTKDAILQAASETSSRQDAVVVAPAAA